MYLPHTEQHGICENIDNDSWGRHSEAGGMWDRAPDGWHNSFLGGNAWASKASLVWDSM